MKRIAIYAVKTGFIQSVAQGDAKSIAATIATLNAPFSYIFIAQDAVVTGMMVKGGKLVPSPKCPKRAEKKLRMERNARLEREVDPVLNNTLLRRSLGRAKTRQWREYRQSLLDITQGDLFAPEWPKKPR